MFLGNIPYGYVHSAWRLHILPAGLAKQHSVINKRFWRNIILGSSKHKWQ